jgi:hypothetical protein
MTTAKEIFEAAKVIWPDATSICKEQGHAKLYRPYIAGCYLLSATDIDWGGHDCYPPPAEPKWVPFENAKEFEPHRDRWIRRLNDAGCVRVSAYDDDGVWFDSGHVSYLDCVTKRQFEDGTPCGKQVK